MQQLTEFAIAQFVRALKAKLPAKLDCFDDILLQDGSSFRVHDGLAEVFPSRFPTHPAAIESSYDAIAQTSNAENHDDHGRYSLRAGIFAENGTDL